jgi:Putative serine esterase (DUF676)
MPFAIPQAGTNNVWFLDRASDHVIVFVHGILSDSRGCWQDDVASQYWPSMLAEDSRFANFSIFLGGYYTAPDAGPYDVANCAHELMSALARPLGSAKPVLSRKTVIFVCHSTGGIVVRYMLDSSTSSFSTLTQIGLVLIASPSYGSRWANRLSLLTKFYNNKLGIRLEWGNWSLEDLDDRFKRLLSEKRLPQLQGAEAYENHFILHRKWLPDKALVVTKESAGKYFGPPVLLRKTNHFTSVKPDSITHPSYEFLFDFIHKLSRSSGDPLLIESQPITVDPEITSGHENSPPGKSDNPAGGKSSSKSIAIPVALLIVSASSVFGFLLGRLDSIDFSSPDGVPYYLLTQGDWKPLTPESGELAVTLAGRRYIFRTGDTVPRVEFISGKEIIDNPIEKPGILQALNSNSRAWWNGPERPIVGAAVAAGGVSAIWKAGANFTQGEARLAGLLALLTGGVLGYWVGSLDRGDPQAGAFAQRLGTDSELWAALDKRFRFLCVMLKTSDALYENIPIYLADSVASSKNMSADLKESMLSYLKWRDDISIKKPEFRAVCKG